MPVHSAKKNVHDCKALLCGLRDSLLNTTELDKPLLVFGVDDDDEVYLEGESVLLRTLFADFPLCIEKLPKRSATVDLKGAICKIWNHLAVIAFEDHGADFTCLLGDDVILLSTGWQAIIEGEFHSVAQARGLPYGAACVAFEDITFKGFPTFPVIHRWHFEALGGQLLPYQFINQGGDPFLFELYKRFGAARFAMGCTLKNTIGGREDARYMKQRIRFEDAILSTAVRTIRDALGAHIKPFPCLDVVVPAFRCDLAALTRITQLRASREVFVSFWVILDNPKHPNADKVRGLQTVAQNYQINVRGHEKNYGASAARNFGLGHSKADWVILIDDDVTPEAELLDAYLGALMRFPQASVLVGSTHLPPPKNWLTHAIVASDIPGAYNVAEKTMEPPWGVTANLCVRGRTSRLRFDLRYPKTGGGEDLDYCAKAREHGPIKAVPGALAHHPWWNEGGLGAVGHILGWANGEVLCVGSSVLRKHIFWTPPNGVECACLVLPLMILVAPFPDTISGMVLVIAIPCCILVFELMWHASRIGSHRLHSPMTESLWRCIGVRCCAGVLIMLQEWKRFMVALSHSPSWLFWRVDWHFGQNPYFVWRTQRSNACRAMLYVVLAIVLLVRLATRPRKPAALMLRPQPGSY